MLPKTAIINTPLTFYKNKSKKDMVSFDPDFKSDTCNVNYMYMEKKPVGVKSFWEWEITQGPFDEEFFKLKGKKYKHLRNIINRNEYCYWCGVRGTPYKNYNYEECEELLNKWWDGIGDKNYGWNVHLGYDKRYLKESIKSKNVKNNTINLFFYGAEECTHPCPPLRGYSIFSKPVKDSDGLWNLTYMLGKYDPDKELVRDLSRLIDFYSYKYIFNNVTNHEPFKVNLGTAKGGLLQYKEMVFPTYSKEKRYFYKIKPEEKIIL